jgi:hypothetical protein
MSRPERNNPVTSPILMQTYVMPYDVCGCEVYRLYSTGYGYRMRLVILRISSMWSTMVLEIFYRSRVLYDLNLTYQYKRSANLPLPSVSAGLGVGNGIFGASKSHSSFSLPYTSRKLDAAPFSCTSCRTA